MIQTRDRNRRQRRLAEERIMRKDPLGPSKGLVAGGFFGAIIWVLVAVMIA